jgi:hypothetical protein
MRTFGSRLEVEPHVALIEEVRRTAGHVAWVNEVVGDLLQRGRRLLGEHRRRGKAGSCLPAPG